MVGTDRHRTGRAPWILPASRRARPSRGGPATTRGPLDVLEGEQAWTCEPLAVMGTDSALAAGATRGEPRHGGAGFAAASRCACRPLARRVRCASAASKTRALEATSVNAERARVTPV